MGNMIETHRITRSFGHKMAVNGVDIGVKKGEVFGLLGPNGAGKTTLLSMLCTILRPTSGTASVNGYDIIAQSNGVRRSIGIVFQDPSVDASLTARENLVMHADLYGVPPDSRKGRISSVLRLVELEDRADDFITTYSGGMRRRLEIARGLLHYPKVLFLDEPTIGLDPQSREHIWAYIRGLKKKEDMTIILTTHYMEEADRLCDRVAIIDHGRIVALDTPPGLKGNVGGDTVVMGTKDADLLSKILVEGGAARMVQVDGDELKVAVEDARASIPRLIEAAITAGIRVDHVSPGQPDMNDVFIHHTGKEIRHEGGEELYGRMAMRRRRLR